MTKKRNKHRVQNSKRARLHRKQAKHAGLSRRIAHPSHYTSRLHWKRWHWVQPGRKWKPAKRKPTS